MKKAQVLSALALAFALGVTPVISTVNTVSALTIADATKGVEGKATQADVKAAVAAIRANQTYRNMVNLRDQLAKLSPNAGKVEGYEYADFEVGGTGTNGVSYSTAFGKVYAAIAAIDTAAYEGTTKRNFVDQIDEIVPVAENMGSNNGQRTSVYGVMAPIFAAIANHDDAAFVAALNNYNIRFEENFVNPYNKFDTTNENKISDYIYGAINEVKTNFDGIMTSGAYDKYLALYNAVEYAKESKAKYVAGYNALTAAFDAPGVLSIPNGHNNYVRIVDKKIALNGNESATMSLLYLASLASESNIPVMLNRYSQWLNLDVKVQSAEKSMNDANNNYNYDLVMQMAKALKDAEMNTRQTAEQIAQTLVGYVAPSTDTNKVTTLTSADGNVTVTGVFAEGTRVIATASDKKVAAFGNNSYALYDINLVDANGNKVNAEGSVLVSIKVPAGLDGTKSSIYYVTDEGKVEKLAARFENGNMVYTVSHFSLYAIVEDNGMNFGITTPDTGIVSSAEGNASTTVAMVAGVATALTAAGAGVVAYRNARRSTRK